MRTFPILFTVGTEKRLPFKFTLQSNPVITTSIYETPLL